MNKRITSILLCLMMVLSMLATAVPAVGAIDSDCIFTVEADKSEAYRGDTITFTVYMQQTGKQNTLEFTIDPPDGLTYVANSGTAAANLSATLNWTGAGEGAGWTEASMYFSGFGGYSYTGTGTIELMTFKCTVDADAEFKAYSFGLIDCWADDDTYTSKNAVDVPATFSVVAKPVAVTGVTIDETLAVSIGQSKTPAYTVNPAEATNKNVSFKSSDSTVATVNETTGEVTGVKSGVATITITTKDGNFTDTCTVTVSCAHANKTPVAEKASDCKTKGWDAYTKCSSCGQLFTADGLTELAEIPYRALSQNHTGGSATCTAQAVCTVCGNPYGALASHNYTSATKKAEALKTAGNCRDIAVYYYSCSACGKVENNDAHTFNGEKDPAVHVGGTRVEGASPADHKTQTVGSTGTTICNGCNAPLGSAQPIQPGAHVPASTWTTDETHHWKECTVVGCGTVIDGSKTAHSSTGANVATCQKKAVCDVCAVSYGTVAPHVPATSWSKDASGHWYACTTTGCLEKLSFATHTPDHPGNATEEYAIKCTECLFIIQNQLGHTHVFDQQVANDTYKATSADCKKLATYYFSCRCGEKGSTTFEYGRLAEHDYAPATCTSAKKCRVCGEDEPGSTALGHTPDREWKYDSTNHWKVCINTGCGVVIESTKEAHKAGSNPSLCGTCGYTLSRPSVHVHLFNREIAEDKYIATKATCTTPATYYKSCICGDKGTETFTAGSVGGHTPGEDWKYDKDNHWHTCQIAGCGVIIDSTKAAHTPDRAAATETDPIKCTVCGYVIAPASTHTHTYGNEWKSDVGNHWQVCACGNTANTAAHSDTNKDGKCDICGYQNGTFVPPLTGDMGMAWIWVALLVLSGFGAVITAVICKKRSVR